MRYVIGVDEAGRGALAGPVAIGLVAVPERFVVAREFPGVADSKQLTPRARDVLFRELRRRADDGDLLFCVRYSGAPVIDRRGLTRAVASATARGVRFLAPEPDGVSVLLDGLLYAPPEYRQQTIIGGDESVPLISLASIAAKVLRDRLMTRFSRQFPEYGFDIHKGYGTKAHYAALKKHGPSDIHRRLFLGLEADER